MLVMQEDLASAEAELAGWYETMQRETHALKRLYQQDPTHESLKPKAGPAGSDHAVGDSLAAQAAVEGTDSDRVIPEWLTKGRQQMKSGEKGDRVAARQLPQVALAARCTWQPSVWYACIGVHVCEDRARGV